MTAPSLTFDQFVALKPCPERRQAIIGMIGDAATWNGRAVTAAEAKAAGATLADLVWAASAVSRANPDVERRLRLWMADCAAHVLHIYEATETGEAPRQAIMAARRFARGEIDAAAWAAARDAASAAASAAGSAAASAAAWAAAARVAAWDAAAWDAAWAAARVAAWAAARTAGRDAARDAEEAWQLDRLVAWLSDDEPQDWPLPERVTAPKTEAA